jgi:hypothetical protein
MPKFLEIGMILTIKSELIGRAARGIFVCDFLLYPMLGLLLEIVRASYGRKLMLFGGPRRRLAGVWEVVYYPL